MPKRAKEIDPAIKDKILTLRKAGVAVEGIMRQVGMKRWHVEKVLKTSYLLATPSHGNIKPIDSHVKEQIISSRRKGLSINNLSSEFGISVYLIRELLSKEAPDLLPARLSSSLIEQMTQADLAEIHRLFIDGNTTKHIAKLFGLTVAAVQKLTSDKDLIAKRRLRQVLKEKPPIKRRYPPTSKLNVPPELRSEIVARRLAGEGFETIGRSIEMKGVAVKEIFLQERPDLTGKWIPINRSPKSGRKMVVLSSEQEETIRQMHRDGMSLHTIAKEMGRGYGVIQRAVEGGGKV